ncbi:MAG: serine/threonine protein kinase [Labilithrix sp.]|nr:serine/threonine protein kinase [Labilithrix sp.]
MSSQVPALGALLVNRYELVKELGRGGCAIVFEAHDHRLARAVAVKVPIGIAGDTAKVGRFAREARVIASIHHPNVCAVLDSGFTEDGAPFLVMERLFGESLRATLHRAKQLGVGDAIAIGLQLLSALDAVHAAGIVHRDIKPDNVVLVSRGGCDPLVKLLDFGLCRRSARRRTDEETMTCDGALVGTPEYMAPEQVLGSTSLDVRVDIYAVGVVLYEALTGDRAFFAKNVRDILTGVMNKKLRPLCEARRDVPRSLEVVVARAMSRDPARRHASAVELQDDLVAVKEEMAARARAAQRRAEVELWDLPTTPFQRRPAARRPTRAPASAG